MGSHTFSKLTVLPRVRDLVEIQGHLHDTPHACPCHPSSLSSERAVSSFIALLQRAVTAKTEREVPDFQGFLHFISSPEVN